MDCRSAIFRSNRARLGALAMLTFCVISQAHAVCYVDSRVAGSNNGSSWADSYTNLRSALNDSGCKEIWVAKGVYKPTRGSDRTISFEIKPDVAVYGGFNGDEATRDARDPVQNRTVLSGDIDNNDANATGDQIDNTPADINGHNSFHVVTVNGTAGTPVTAATVLDGVTITGGQANGISFAGNGGGLYCFGAGTGHDCSPTLNHLTFIGNTSRIAGGAMYDDGSIGGNSSPTLTDVVFDTNFAGTEGGAIYNQGDAGTSSPKLTNVTFVSNGSGAMGGAMYNLGPDGGESSPTLTNVTFKSNSSPFGGAIFNDGSLSGNSSPILNNVTFADNQTPGGGAIYNFAYSGTSAPSLSNVILWNDADPEILNLDAAPTLNHSIVEGGCPSGASCTAVVAVDPKLKVLANNGGSTLTMMPADDSPAVDAGDDATCPAADQRGIARPQGAHCDIGAVEWQSDIIFRDGFELP